MSETPAHSTVFTLDADAPLVPTVPTKAVQDAQEYGCKPCDRACSFDRVLQTYEISARFVG